MNTKLKKVIGKPRYVIYQIPLEWNLLTLGQICDDVYRYPTYYDIEYVEDGIREIRGKLIREYGKLESDHTQYRKISKETSSKFPRTIVKENDLVFTVRGTMGKIAIIAKEFVGCNITANLMRISPNKNKIFPKFLIHYMLSPNFQNILEVLSPQTTIKTIQSNELTSIRIPQPPIPEQQKIASILSNVDDSIQKTTEQLEKTKQLKTGLMQKLLTKGIGHTKFKKVKFFPYYKEEIIPEDWNYKLIDNLLKIIDYRGRTPPFSEKGIPHLRSNNIRNGKINSDDLTYVISKVYDEYMIRGIPKENDVLFTTEGPLGEVATVPFNFKFSLAQRIIVLRPKTSELDPGFLKYILLDSRVKKRYFGLGTGTTLVGIASKWFTKLFLPYPKKLTEQQKIASILSNVDSQIDSLESKKSQLQKTKRGLMQKLLTGKIRVPLN